MNEKPGIKTSEFWLSLSAALMSFLLASGITDDMSDTSIWMRLVAAGTTVLTALGYTVSRSIVKTKGTR